MGHLQYWKQDLFYYLRLTQHCASFELFEDNFGKKFSTRNTVLLFLEYRRSNQVETIQHIKNVVLKTSLRISMGTQNYLKQIVGKSLDP